MSFYLRKSVKVGPIRFNLSKSGIGVSAGIKGLRFGSGPRGNYVHMGRHGVYYRATLPTSVPPAAHPPPLPQPAPQQPQPEALTPIESGSVASMVDASSAELLAEINAKRKRWRIAPWVFLAFFIAAIALNDPSRTGPAAIVLTIGFLAAWIVCTWAAHRHDVLSKTTVLFFDIDDNASEPYQALYDAFNALAKCGGRWKIEARGATADWKHQAGASHLVRRKSVALGTEPPHWIKTNIAVPSIPLGRETLCFFPDRLLVLSSSGAGAVSYDVLNTDVVSQRFIESERVPSDTKIVGQSWKYPNKSGGPDKRFKNNRQLPVVLYEHIALSSGSGLNAVLQVSRVDVGGPFREALSRLRSTAAVAPPPNLTAG